MQHGRTGLLVAPDDVDGLRRATVEVASLDRRHCRAWVEANASQEVFAQRVEEWIRDGLVSRDGSIA